MLHFLQASTGYTGLLLEKDLVQTEFTSKYVTKLIETELENVMADLQVSREYF